MSENRMYNNRRNRQGRKRNKPREKQVSNELCPLCSQPLGDLLTAMEYRPNGGPCHFDCVVKELEKTEELKDRERICYLGNGSFGIVLQYSGNNANRFFVRKRIRIEDSEKHPLWRKKLSFV